MQDITSQEIQKFLLFLLFKGNNKNVLLNFLSIAGDELFYKQLGSRRSERAAY